MGGPKRWAAALAVLSCLLGPAIREVRAAGEPAESLLESARKAFDRKRYGRAARLAQRVARRHPGTAAAQDAFLVWIDGLMEQGNLSRALQVCERMLEAYPRSTHRTAVLRRELTLGDAMTRRRVNFYLFRLSRLDEGVKILEKVVEHAPFGPLADDAVLAIADAYLAAGRHEDARDQYDRLLKRYPNSTLALRARVSRAQCNYEMTGEAPYDTAPAREAKRELGVLSKVSGDEELVRRTGQMRDLLAKVDYDTGLFYVRRGNIAGAERYMKAVIAKYPKSEYARRADRILATIRAAQGEETP